MGDSGGRLGPALCLLTHSETRGPAALLPLSRFLIPQGDEVRH